MRYPGDVQSVAYAQAREWLASSESPDIKPRLKAVRGFALKVSNHSWTKSVPYAVASGAPDGIKILGNIRIREINPTLSRTVLTSSTIDRETCEAKLR